MDEWRVAARIGCTLAGRGRPIRELTRAGATHLLRRSASPAHSDQHDADEEEDPSVRSVSRHTCMPLFLA